MIWGIFSKLRRLRAAQDGSIAVMGAIALTSVIGMSGLAVELGNGYAAKVRNQRVADLAAYGAAVAYRAGNQTNALATQVANDLVIANGLPTSTATTQVTTINGTKAIQVTVATSVPIKIASLISNGLASYTIRNTAYASLVAAPQPTMPGCIVTLKNSATSISATGGASVNANGCNIVSNGTIYSSNSSAKVSGNMIVAAGINDTAAAYGSNAITATAGIVIASAAASDYVASGSTASEVRDALCQVNKLTGQSDTYDATTNPYGYVGGNTNCTSLLVAVPTLTAATSPDWSTGYNKKTTTGFDQYETADYSCAYVVPAGTYSIRNLTIGGGCSVQFQGPSTLSFNNVTMNGDTLTFGDGPITIAGTFTVNGNKTVTMGNGAHSFGTLSISGGKSLSIGTGNLVVGNGISVSGGAFFKANISTGETVTLGKNSSTGDSLTGGGSSQICFTSNCLAPTADAGTFSAAGNVSQPGSGSTIVFPNSRTHIINGDVTLTAAAIFGKGLYIIKGNWSNGTGCGACVMSGTDVTFALGGTFNFAGGSYFDLAAPAEGSSYGITDMLILTKTASATSLGGGANGKASGVIYAPNSATSSSGGTSISSNGSKCLMLLVNTIAVSGSGTINISGCTSQATTSNVATGTVTLLQ